MTIVYSDKFVVECAVTDQFSFKNNILMQMNFILNFRICSSNISLAFNKQTAGTCLKDEAQLHKIEDCSHRDVCEAEPLMLLTKPLLVLMTDQYG